MLERTELAWAAGFFDGEGTTHLARQTKERNGQTFGPYLQLQVSISQVGDDCLLRFQDAVGGLGRIYDFTRLTGAGNSVLRWQVNGRTDGRQVLALLWPFLTRVKREQAVRCLREIDEYDLTHKKNGPRSNANRPNQKLEIAQ